MGEKEWNAEEGLLIFLPSFIIFLFLFIFPCQFFPFDPSFVFPSEKKPLEKRMRIKWK